MRTRPSLAIISFSSIASDARVLKQVTALRDRYAVTVVGYGPSVDGVEEFIAIPDDRVYWRYSRAALILRAYRFAYWRNPAVAFVRRALRGRRFDVVLANDVDTVGLALALKPVGGVHVDLHEYAPRQKEEVPRWRRFVAPFVRWMCSMFVANASSWTTVGNGLAREYEREFGFRPDIVTNAAPYAPLLPQPVATPIRLVHSGVCLRNRNLMALIDAVALAQAPVTLDLYVTPNDPAYLEELRERARAVGSVVVHDPVPYRELVETLNAYDVGVFAGPPVNFNAEWALPNKLFDFVQARLGVVVGPSPEMAAYVESHGFGRVAAGFDAAAIADAYDALSRDEVEAWKARSAAVAEELSAEHQVLVWERAVDELSAARR